VVVGVSKPEDSLSDVAVTTRDLKRFPSDLNRWDSQEVKDGRVFVH